MQSLWLGTFGWDEELPPNLKQEWKTIKLMLTRCSTVKIPRWVGFKKQNKHLSIHGFCDASIKAYAAVIYLRTCYEDDIVETHLLTSKTKIAPLKQICIPRLELCAAELLAKLIDKVKLALNLSKCEIYAWSDSSVTLAWISTPSYQLKSFVGTRVTKIQHTVEAEKWRYIKSAENPADCATRCNYASEIVSLTRWWNGPKFLLDPPELWPKTPPNMIKNVPELRSPKVMHQKEEYTETENELLNKFSSLPTLLRITAIIMRWKKQYSQFRKNKVILATELHLAKIVWIRYVQKLHYAVEIDRLKTGKALPMHSQILSLTPYLDADDVLRVQGRLTKALLPTNMKHPAILPTTSHFTTLIIRQAHFQTLHGGLHLTLRTVRDEFWIVQGKNTVKNILRKCVTCFRDKCRPVQQQMADLKAPQVQANRPFSHTGVDFAGYFLVKASQRKNANYNKCYVSLFICLTTG